MVKLMRCPATILLLVCSLGPIGCAKESSGPSPAKGAIAAGTPPAKGAAAGSAAPSAKPATGAPPAAPGSAVRAATPAPGLPAALVRSDHPTQPWGESAPAPAAATLDAAMRNAFAACAAFASTDVVASLRPGDVGRTVVASACQVDASQGLYRTFLWSVEQGGTLTLRASDEAVSDEFPRAQQYYVDSIIEGDNAFELACADIALVVGEQHRKGNFLCGKTGAPWDLGHQE